MIGGVYVLSEVTYATLWVSGGDDRSEAAGGNTILYSENGINWQRSTGICFTTEGYGVAYGTSNGTSPLWVAVGYDGSAGGNTILYSENGINWQRSTGICFNGTGYGVAYGTSNGTSSLWVAVGYESGSGNTILYSENGISWQRSTGICFDYIGLGVAFDHLLYGMSPTYYHTYNSGGGGGNTVIPASLGAVGYEGGGGNTILYSENGISWQPSNGGICFTVGGVGVAYGISDGTSSPLWVAVGEDDDSGNTILYSENGENGQSCSGSCVNSFGCGVADGTSNVTSPLWVAVGGGGSR